LIFNEGYVASSGPQVHRLALAEEAIRLTRMLHRLLPADDEVRGLLALMLLTHARRAARTTPDGALVPLAEQDRARWDRTAISEEVDLISGPLSAGMVGPFQLQAAIAAVHAEAPSPAETDWREITALYELLERIAPNPVFTLNRAVAVAMFRGPEAGLELLAAVERDGRLSGRHRIAAVRGHLLELAGDTLAAAAAYATGSAAAAGPPDSRGPRDRRRRDLQGARGRGAPGPGRRPTHVRRRCRGRRRRAVMASQVSIGPVCPRAPTAFARRRIPGVQWRRWELNPRPQSHARRRLRA
jgi:predicted RNA polymerase sigma factor